MSDAGLRIDRDLALILRSAAERRGLTTALPRLEAEALPSIAITVGDTSAELPLGTSRLGGAPELSTEWPAHEGRLMRFVGQIQLAELPRSVASALPAKGLLSFFVGPDEPASDVVHRVVYSPGGLLHPLRLPANASAWGDPSEWGAAPLSFRPAISLPPADKLIDTESQWADFHALARELLPTETRMLGHPEQLNSDPALDAYLCRTGHADILYDPYKRPAELEREIAAAWADCDEDRAERLEAQRASRSWFHADVSAHESASRIWRVLLQVGSHRHLDMTWWDAGVLTFLIDERDLARGDFTRTYAAIQTT